MNQQAEREWRGIWIPKEVWLDERLNALEKIVLFEVDSLDREKGCIASNDYIAGFCQCSAWKVSTAIQKLIDLGYIRIESFDGRHRTLRSNLVFSTRQPCENPNSAFGNSQAINNSYKNKTEENISSIFEPDGFAEFWKAYPKHEAKKDAIKAWNALKPKEDLRNTIIADLTKRLGSGGAWFKTENKYIPLPATYIRGARWEDESIDGTTDKKPDEPYWKNLPWWEWPKEEQERLEREVEERERNGMGLGHDSTH